MDTPKTRYVFPKKALDDFIHYVCAYNDLDLVYPTIFKNKALRYGPLTSNLLLQLPDFHLTFEAVQAGSLEDIIIATLQSPTKTLKELKKQLDQAQLQESIKKDGWKKVSDGNEDLGDKDTTIRNDIQKLESYVEAFFLTAETKQSDLSTSSGEERA